MSAFDGPSKGFGTNTGHGHVWKRPDRMVARCGGRELCGRCKADYRAFGGPLDRWIERVDELIAERDQALAVASTLRAERDRLADALLEIHQLETGKPEGDQ